LILAALNSLFATTSILPKANIVDKVPVMMSRAASDDKAEADKL
jgi:hypothetical protein